MTSVLIFGQAGQVASELAALTWPHGWTVTFMGRVECDLLIAGAAANAIQSVAPDIVVNAAAYTAVDKAESEKEAAFALNAAAPAEMAAAAATIGARLIHISTDYVFDGRADGAYRESDPCAPLSVYGASKLAGEIGIRDRQTRHVILRTSWVFSPYGTNFVRTMLRLGSQRKELAIVDDQSGGPTAAADIAAAVATIAAGLIDGSTAFGTYHYAGDPVTTWYGFARAIFEEAAKYGLKTPATVHPIGTSDYPTPAARPMNSTLDCAAIARDWGIRQPLWQNSLSRCIKTLANSVSV